MTYKRPKPTKEHEYPFTFFRVYLGDWDEDGEPKIEARRFRQTAKQWRSPHGFGSGEEAFDRFVCWGEHKGEQQSPPGYHNSARQAVTVFRERQSKRAHNARAEAKTCEQLTRWADEQIAAAAV